MTCSYCHMELKEGEIHPNSFACLLAWKVAVSDGIFRMVDVVSKMQIDAARRLDAVDRDRSNKTQQLMRIADALGVEWWDGDFPLDEVLKKINSINDRTIF